MRKILLLLLIPLGALIGCDALKTNGATKDFRTATTEWKSQNIANYEFTLTKMCFCAFTTPVKVVVKDHKINAIQDSLTGAALDYPKEWFQTIDELFSWIEEARANKPELLVVKYDAQYGFPAEIQYDYSKMMADEEFSLTITNFKKR